MKQFHTKQSSKETKMQHEDKMVDSFLRLHQQLREIHEKHAVFIVGVWKYMSPSKFELVKQQVLSQTVWESGVLDGLDEIERTRSVLGMCMSASFLLEVQKILHQDMMEGVTELCRIINSAKSSNPNRFDHFRRRVGLRVD